MSRTTWDFKAHFGPKLFLYWLARRLRWQSMEQKLGEELFHWMTPYVERSGQFWYLGQSGENGQNEKLFYEMLDKGALALEKEVIVVKPGDTIQPEKPKVVKGYERKA